MGAYLKQFLNLRAFLFLCGSFALVAIPGLNCHSPTNVLTNSRNPQGLNTSIDDDSAKIVHSQPVPDMAPYEVDIDGAPVGEQKVRLSEEVAISASRAASMGVAGVLSSEDDAVIAKGTKLLFLYDNNCRGKVDSPLNIEAEEIVVEENLSLAAVQSEAEQDPCLLRIGENKQFQLIEPLPDVAQKQFQALSNDVSKLATVDDPRAREARHIASSKAIESWDSFYSEAGIGATDYREDVIVAVIDTGVLATHPDLVENAYKNAQGKNGYDFVNDDEDPRDEEGHGTHVAGIIGARANNKVGVTGVMGTRVKIMGVRVLGPQGGSTSDIVNGIRYAADNGAHVINMSLGGNGSSPDMRDAMRYAAEKGVVIVIAAGNDNRNISPTSFVSPAGFSKDVPGSITVGSLDSASGARSGFSNYNPEYVWIGAPGSNGILSTFLNNGYQALQGTSMASPVVAGAAALVVGAFRARGISYKPVDVINILTDSAHSMDGLKSSFRNGAKLDIERAAKLFFSRYVMSGDAAAESAQ